MRRGILLAKSESELRLLVLHPVSLVHNDVLPRHLAESRLVVEDVFICSDYNMELVVFEVLGKQWSLVLFPFVYDLAYVRRPLIELHYPVRDRGQGDHN